MPPSKIQRILDTIQRFRPLWEFFAVVIATTSLAFGVYQYHLSVKTERESRALRYATEFVSNSEFNLRQAEIRNLSQNWHDFILATKETEDGKKLKADIGTILNELEVIAGSVNTHSCDEAVTKRHFDELIFMYCTAHLYGQSGKVPSCEWVAYPNSTPLFPHDDEYVELKKLYNRWFPDRLWKNIN